MDFRRMKYVMYSIAIILAVAQAGCFQGFNVLSNDINEKLLLIGGNSSNPTQVATPALNPIGGTYNAGQSVTITCATSGTTIRYTTAVNWCHRVRS
jgi:hypothetical protein